MQMADEASLLDDARFVEELAKLEALPEEDTSGFPKPVPTVAESSHPVVIADGLPPARGPRTKGPQFVLAPPPSGHKSTHRRSGRAVLRIRTSARDEQPARIESVSTIRSAPTDANADERWGALAVVREADKNPEAEAILNAFATESAIREPKAKDRRVKEPGRSSAIHPALAVVGFVLLMTVGAGAAALVFHDRVAQIVAVWQSASR